VSTTIRLTRMGRKKRPFYRLVAVDHRKRRDGAYLANLGYYNPFTDPFDVKLHTDEIITWLSRGATVSETARNLLKGEGILYRYSLVKQGVDAAEIEARVTTWKQGAEAGEAKRVQEKTARLAKAAAEKKAAEEAEAKAKAEAEAAAKAAEEAEAKAKADEEAAAAAAEGEATEQPAEGDS
jgi:small subunit ribosomal protein S16